MSDIVERLRVTTLWRHSTPPSQELEETDLGLEAAAEIERLNGLLEAKTTPGYEVLAATIEARDAEIERLRRDLKEARGWLGSCAAYITGEDAPSWEGIRAFLERTAALEGK